MRITLSLAIFGISFFLGSATGRLTKQQTARHIEKPLAMMSKVQQPSAALLPDEVVRLQVDALQRFANDPAAIEQCFVLASVSNRAVTGPLDRFSALVLTPKYQALVHGDHVLVGNSAIRGGNASVLVTVLDENRHPRLFRFFLSKQTLSEYQDCWMTDAVIATQGRAPSVSSSSSSPDV